MLLHSHCRLVALTLGACCPKLDACMPDSVAQGRADYHGSSINQAARYMDAGAHGGQVVCEDVLALNFLQVCGCVGVCVLGGGGGDERCFCAVPSFGPRGEGDPGFTCTPPPTHPPTHAHAHTQSCPQRCLRCDSGGFFDRRCEGRVRRATPAGRASAGQRAL